MYRVIETVTERRLTSIDKAGLCDLAQTAMDLEFDSVDGEFLQAGCGMGGAAIVIAHAKRRNRAFNVYDPFNADAQAETRVRDELGAHRADERLGVRLIGGPYAETVSVESPVALVHLDSGKYEPMKILLERTAPKLVAGGHIIIDDYATRPECKRAVDEYFNGKSGFQLVRKSRVHIIKS